MLVGITIFVGLVGGVLMITALTIGITMCIRQNTIKLKEL